MKYFILGHKGLLGSEFKRQLDAKGHEFAAINNADLIILAHRDKKDPLNDIKTNIEALNIIKDRKCHVVLFSSMYSNGIWAQSIYKGTEVPPLTPQYVAAKASVSALMYYYATIKPSIKFTVLYPKGIFNGHSHKFCKQYEEYFGEPMLDVSEYVTAQLDTILKDVV